MTADAGILLRQEVSGARAMAEARGLALAVGEGWEPRWPRTLFVAAGAAVPWDLVAAGFRFLEHWTAAAPFPLERRLAESVGTEEERERTRAVVYDLRMPVYSMRLLFVRDDTEGRELLLTWRSECAGGSEGLAFLRALAAIKPPFLALPRLWLATAEQRAELDRFHPGAQIPVPRLIIRKRPKTVVAAPRSESAPAWTSGLRRAPSLEARRVAARRRIGR